MQIIQKPSPNFDARPDGLAIDMLILHYTGMKSGDAALERLCDAQAEVSAHYLVEEDGRIYQLVPEEMRAWHAGVSFWRGHTNINARSIGIEIVNPGHEWGYRPFPTPQIESVISLCQDILSRHKIEARNVVGHSDVAPARKQDPGELFPWKILSNQGIGIWPNAVSKSQLTLSQLGYSDDKSTENIRAFQRHFTPDNLSGELDDQTQEALACLSEHL